MPEYLKTRKQEGPWRKVVIMGIDTAVVLGVIGLFGGGFIERAKTIASGQGLPANIGFMQPQPKQQERARRPRRNCNATDIHPAEGVA